MSLGARSAALFVKGNGPRPLKLRAQRQLRALKLTAVTQEHRIIDADHLATVHAAQPIHSTTISPRPATRRRAEYARRSVVHRGPLRRRTTRPRGQAGAAEPHVSPHRHV